MAPNRSAKRQRGGGGGGDWLRILKQFSNTFRSELLITGPYWIFAYASVNRWILTARVAAQQTTETLLLVLAEY